MLPPGMRYSFRVDYDMIVVTGTHIPPAISLHTDHLDIPHHLREYSLIKGKEDWPKSRRPNQRSGSCFVFTSYFYSLFLSPSLFYFPLWPYFSLSLPLPLALRQRETTVHMGMHTFADKDTTPHKDISQIPLRAGETKCMS